MFVVIIHSRMTGRDGLMPAIVVAVPCFYAISGYFLYTGNRQKEIRRAHRWIIKVLLITTLTNMTYLSFFHLLGRHYAWRALAFNIFSGSVISVHLWYLSAFWQALLLFLLIRRYCPRLVHLLPCLLLLNQATARYSFLFWNEPPAVWLRCNSITVALPCLSLGYLLAYHQKRLMSLPGIALLPLIFIALTYMEDFLLTATGTNNHISYLLSTPLLAFSLVLLCIRYPQFSLPAVAEIGKRHSAHIYYVHIAVAVLLTMILEKYFSLSIDSFAPVLTFTGSILFSFGLQKVLKLIQQWLNPKPCS